MLHVLLDRIPDTDVPAARKFLRALADPVQAALLDAPADDESVSAHERAAWQADEQRRLRADLRSRPRRCFTALASGRIGQ